MSAFMSFEKTMLLRLIHEQVAAIGHELVTVVQRESRAVAAPYVFEFRGQFYRVGDVYKIIAEEPARQCVYIKEVFPKVVTVYE